VKINLTDPDLYSHGDPYAVWRWLRENDPVHWHPPGDLPGFWVLTKYDGVRAAYRDPATFSSASGIILRPEAFGDDPGGGRTLALTDPPRHRKLRGLVDEWFSLRSVRALDAEMRDIAHDVVTRALEHVSCDFVSEIAARIPLY
jgi:cytochrome P450